MAGRKLAFDREEVLEKAMNLFWHKGYTATGLSDLTKHMGIQRQSLYNTFGSKHALFLEAVGHYGNTVVRRIEKQLDEAGSPLGNIRNLFRTLSEEVAHPQYRGCLIANTIIELAAHDPEVVEVVRRLTKRLERAFERALERAIEAGELSASKSPRELAHFLYHIMLGFNVRGKVNSGRSYIDELLAVALSVLS